jgi:hypothetical protein
MGGDQCGETEKDGRETARGGGRYLYINAANLEVRLMDSNGF